MDIPNVSEEDNSPPKRLSSDHRAEETRRFNAQAWKYAGLDSGLPGLEPAFDTQSTLSFEDFVNDVDQSVASYFDYPPANFVSPPTTYYTHSDTGDVSDNNQLCTESDPGPWGCDYVRKHDEHRDRFSLPQPVSASYGKAEPQNNQDSDVSVNASKPGLSCPNCSRPFENRDDLRRHRRYHDQRKHACHCGKRFVHPKDLRRHEQTHTPNGAVPCPVDGCTTVISAGRPDNVKRHIMKKHPEFDLTGWIKSTSQTKPEGSVPAEEVNPEEAKFRAPETKAAISKANKRTSIFGISLEKARSPTTEKKKPEVTLVVPSKDTKAPVTEEFTRAEGPEPVETPDPPLTDLEEPDEPPGEIHTGSNLRTMEKAARKVKEQGDAATKAKEEEKRKKLVEASFSLRSKNVQSDDQGHSSKFQQEQPQQSVRIFPGLHQQQAALARSQAQAQQQRQQHQQKERQSRVNPTQRKSTQLSDTHTGAAVAEEESNEVAVAKEQGETAKQQGHSAHEEPSTRPTTASLPDPPSDDLSNHSQVDKVDPLESRIRVWNRSVNADTPTLEQGTKTWSSVRPDGGNHIDEFVSRLNEDDDHCSIVSDAAASIFSVASLASSATDLSTASGYSSDQIIAATQHLIFLLSTCEQLRPLYKTAIESNHIGPERFSRNFRRLLKKYSHDLEEEAHDHLGFLAARLVRAKARSVATDIVQKFQGSRPRPDPSQESLADKDEDSSSDEEARPISNPGIIEDIASASEFLLQSRAFGVLCTEFQKFVAPPLPTEPTPLTVPKADPVPTESPATAATAFPLAGSSSNFPSFFELFNASLERLRIRKPSFQPGKHRVRWECKCGKRFFSDFVELNQGGIAQLEKRIEKSTSARIIRNENTQGNSNKGSAYGRVKAWIRSFPASIMGYMVQKPSQDLPQHNTQSTCTSQSNHNSPPQGVKILNLMSCMRSSRNGKILHQDGLEKVDCDKALFLFMRERIKERRGRLKSTFSLRAIRGIEFVKFFLYMGENVDVRQHERYCNDSSCACLPPEDRAKSTQPGTGPEYECTPIPPGTSPPFSSTFLLHCFESPACVSEQSSVIFDQFPKRTCGKMYGDNHKRTEGWGIYYQEGRDTKKIDLITVVVVIIGSLLFGVLWSVLNMDIQGAFGVSAWWIGVWHVLLSILGNCADRV